MLIQDLFSNNAVACVSDDKCAEELKSALMASFATAVDHGLPPQMALPPRSWNGFPRNAPGSIRAPKSN